MQNWGGGPGTHGDSGRETWGKSLLQDSLAEWPCRSMVQTPGMWAGCRESSVGHSPVYTASLRGKQVAWPVWGQGLSKAPTEWPVLEDAVGSRSCSLIF